MAPSRTMMIIQQQSTTPYATCLISLPFTIGKKATVSSTVYHGRQYIASV
jgi:hypothetical protein